MKDELWGVFDAAQEDMKFIAHDSHQLARVMITKMTTIKLTLCG